MACDKSVTPNISRGKSSINPLPLSLWLSPRAGELCNENISAVEVAGEYKGNGLVEIWLSHHTLFVISPAIYSSVFLYYFFF